MCVCKRTFVLQIAMISFSTRFLIIQSNNIGEKCKSSHLKFSFILLLSTFVWQTPNIFFLFLQLVLPFEAIHTPHNKCFSSQFFFLFYMMNSILLCSQEEGERKIINMIVFYLKKRRRRRKNFLLSFNQPFAFSFSMVRSL